MPICLKVIKVLIKVMTLFKLVHNSRFFKYDYIFARRD